MLPNGKIFSTDYKNNIPVQIDEYFYSKYKDQTITYLPNEDEYSVQQHFKSENGNVSRFLDFDKDGKCKSAFESTDGETRRTEIKLIDGVPYSVHKSTDEVIENNIKIDDVDLTNLQPEPYYDIDYNKILNMEGKKEYYSNGKIEKIITNDGNIYNFNLSGELTDVKNKDYSIQITTKEETVCCNFEPDHQRIEKVLDNGGKIITQYSHDEDSLLAEVFYKNPRTKENKQAFYKDGKLISYSDFNNNFSFDYDENGNLRDLSKEE